jgi:hypothetical protein
MKMFRNPAKRAFRRGWPIMGYVGANGGGKSAAMVWDTLPTLEAGRPVLSTVRLLDYENPRRCEGCTACDWGLVDLGEGHRAAHPLWVPLTNWQQLLEAEHCDVLMDEVTGVASSRESYAMPAPVANKLVQLRRADVVVRWSSPNWARADKIIRECSQAVTFATGHLPVRAVDEAGERQWRNRRLFRWRTYDASEFEDFTVGKREQLAAMQTDLHWGPKSVVFGAYDTFDAVLSIGTVTDTGRCYRCGGSRPTPKCHCDDAGAVAVVAEAAGAKPGPQAAPPRHRDADDTPARVLLPLVESAE